MYPDELIYDYSGIVEGNILKPKISEWWQT